MYSAPYLTLTAGDKGIKCPSESPKQCRKGPLGAPPFATMAILSASHATAHRWLHSLPPRAPGEAPRATRWWMRWSVGTEWPPAAASALPLLLSCRVRKLVAHRASRYLGWSSRQAPLAGVLLPCRSAWRVAASSLECLGWPSRQAPLAGALSPELKYFVLEWLQGNLGGSWRSPGKPCRGVLRLPVHSYRGTKSVPLFLYTDRSPRAWATHKRDALLGQAQNGARAGGADFTAVTISSAALPHDPR